jgi:hypothetical protein
MTNETTTIDEAREILDTLWLQGANRAAVEKVLEALNSERARVAELIEALAPFANRTAEKAMGTKYSALTDSQWRRALETYQSCPGGDMCGCAPREVPRG